MQLYGYFRSSAVFRVRIALNLKGCSWDYRPVDLAQGQQLAPEHTALNPQGLVPALEDGGHVLTQSLAIIEYLEERYPQPALLPADNLARARVRALALAVACEIHPLLVFRGARYLKGTLGVTDEQHAEWSRHWLSVGFEAIEIQLAGSPFTGSCCHGDGPTLADICLIPQVYNARRAGIDMGAYPTIERIEHACLALPAFAQALPENQPDAV